MKVKDIKEGYVIVMGFLWHHYKENAYIEPQAVANNLEEAYDIKSSFEKCDRTHYVVIKRGD